MGEEERDFQTLIPVARSSVFLSFCSVSILANSLMITNSFDFQSPGACGTQINVDYDRIVYLIFSNLEFLLPT